MLYALPVVLGKSAAAVDRIFNFRSNRNAKIKARN